MHRIVEISGQGDGDLGEVVPGRSPRRRIEAYRHHRHELRIRVTVVTQPQFAGRPAAIARTKSLIVQPNWRLICLASANGKPGH